MIVCDAGGAIAFYGTSMEDFLVLCYDSVGGTHDALYGATSELYVVPLD